MNSGHAVFENAFYKSLKLFGGEYELRVPYPGEIIEVYEAPSNLAQYYKDGIIFYKGFYNSLGQYTIRNYWDISSQEFRDKDVWEILGRICHLLGDMTVPAHVHNDEHVPLFFDEDYYEEEIFNQEAYVSWDYYDALNQGGYLDVTNYNNPLKQITTIRLKVE